MANYFFGDLTRPLGLVVFFGFALKVAPLLSVLPVGCPLLPGPLPPAPPSSVPSSVGGTMVAVVVPGLVPALGGVSPLSPSLASATGSACVVGAGTSGRPSPDSPPFDFGRALEVFEGPLVAPLLERDPLLGAFEPEPADM